LYFPFWWFFIEFKIKSKFHVSVSVSAYELPHVLPLFFWFNGALYCQLIQLSERRLALIVVWLAFTLICWSYTWRKEPTSYVVINKQPPGDWKRFAAVLSFMAAGLQICHVRHKPTNRSPIYQLRTNCLNKRVWTLW